MGRKDLGIIFIQTKINQMKKGRNSRLYRGVIKDGKVIYNLEQISVYVNKGISLKINPLFAFIADGPVQFYYNFDSTFSQPIFRWNRIKN